MGIASKPAMEVEKELRGIQENLKTLWFLLNRDTVEERATEDIIARVNDLLA